MKNNRFFRTFIMMIAVLVCLGGLSLTAYAQSNEDEETPPPETTEQESPPNPVSLTPDGNLTLVDDIEGDEARNIQYITVVTKNGNYFYIIIDRIGDTENVYFLNMVDEADLLALIEDMDTAPTTPIVPPQPDPEPTPDPEPQPEEKKGGMGGILLILLIVAAGGGAFYYFRVLKPKQAVSGNALTSDFDELDFDDEDDSDYLDMDDTEQEGDE